jgi:eukaryotic-like serine/threonine-protein kinase
MSSERRDLISDLYHRALARAPEERVAFLAEACNGDEALREEVASLLEFEPASARLLERPALAVAAPAPGATSMIDRRLGPYTIVAPLGAGGMGEVYRARDSRLGREVAIKILPSHFTADPERRSRFAREARLLATLNHPHIGAIYGLEESDGMTALVLELVEGPTLADRLAHGALPLPDALAIARQITDAVAAAHDKGIVHRDLKPANIVLTGEPSNDLRAKVLDFGIAKAMALDAPAVPPRDTSSAFEGTADGRVLGTPAYMSPEQARGQTVDRRTDVWAFGCLLYEMLTGRPPFEGDTMSDTFVSVLEREPDWMALPPATPAPIRRLLERCLRKDPRKRLHDIADAILDIDDAVTIAPDTTGRPMSAPSGLRRRGVLPWLAASALAAALAWVGWLYYHAAGALPTEPTQLTIRPPDGVHFPTAPNFTLSPDGRYVAFTSQSSPPMLWVHSLVTGEAKPLPSTEGASAPFWKPDSQEIGYFVSTALKLGYQLKTVALRGGPPVLVATADSGPTTASWNRRNVIVVAKERGALQKVSATRGRMESATVLAGREREHRAPMFLPDDVHFLYLAQVGATTELRVGSLESKEASESLGPFDSTAVYAGGHLFSVRDGHIGGGNLTVQAFDADRRRLIGPPVALGLSAAVSPPWQYGAFSVSAEGDRLVYVSRGRFLRDLTWRNRAGERVGTVGEPGVFLNVDLSPDDERVAVSRQTQEPGKPLQIDIWTIDVKPGGVARRITEDAALEFDPAWSGDGRQLAFNSNRPDPVATLFGLFIRPSDGGGHDIRVAEPVRVITSPDWSLDNTQIVYMDAGTDGGDLWTVPMSGDRKPSVFLKTPSVEKQPVFSPDGRWIAYCSDSSGRDEVYIRAFPRGETAHTVSRGGGWAPRWRGDGQELFFLGLDGRMMAASVDPAKGTTVGAPRELFRTELSRENNRSYDVTRDGQRFLIPTMLPSDDFRVVLNWRTLLPK